MPKPVSMHLLPLKRHRNFNEYWVCASCGRPRRTNTPNDKACHQCRSTLPPRIRITHVRGEGDLAHEDSRISKTLMTAAAYARQSLGMGTRTFPLSRPSRDFLYRAQQFEQNTRSRKWFCQVFLPSGRYSGILDREICLSTIIQEVIRHMNGKKMMQIRISADLHKWLKLHAAKNDTTMTQIIIDYLERLRQRSEKQVKVDQI